MGCNNNVAYSSSMLGMQGYIRMFNLYASIMHNSLPLQPYTRSALISTFPIINQAHTRIFLHTKYPCLSVPTRLCLRPPRSWFEFSLPTALYSPSPLLKIRSFLLLASYFSLWRCGSRFRGSKNGRDRWSDRWGRALQDKLYPAALLFLTSYCYSPFYRAVS